MTNKSRNHSEIGLERQEVRTVLKSFLEPESQFDVLAIKGDWGVGKTYLIKDFLDSERKEYHYSSIFGALSVDDLKMQLWNNFQSYSKGDRLFKRNWIQKTWRNTSKYSKDISNLMREISPLGKYTSIFTSSLVSLTTDFIINNSFKNKIILIDDLERKSKFLQLDGILGFMENLVENQKCKIVLIYCEDKILDEDKRILNDYREKVIDIEIKLSPSKYENFHIGFGKDDPDENIIFEYLKKDEIQTNNIRVFKKLQWITEKIRPYINDALPVVRHLILEEAIFIALAKFDRKFPVDLHKLLSLGSYQDILLSGCDEEKKLYIQSIRLGYSGTAISDSIIQLVETSIFDQQSFFEAVQKLNRREQRENIKEKLNQACAPYYESFASSEVALRESLSSFLDKYCICLDFRELINIEEIGQVVDLDLNKYKKDWLEYQISKVDNPGKSYEVLSQMLEDYPELKIKFEEKRAELKSGLSIESILEKVIKSSSRSKEETDYLNAFSSEDYKQWLTKNHPEKYAMIREILGMGETCSQNLKRAILMLSSKNKLNSFRAKMLYGIDVEDSEKTDSFPD